MFAIRSTLFSGARLSTGLRSAVGARALTAAAFPQPVTLPELDYDYSALEPAISGEIMTIHHTKHHQTYITNLNAALDKYSDAEAKGDVATMISLHGAIKFNGGGHVNHALFWKNLAPTSQGGGQLNDGKLKSAIEAKWGSLDALKADFNAQTVAVQGSGWGWLAYDPKAKDLTITTCANQDPCSTTGTIPLLGVDVWEHAYYLQYKNVRPDYLNEIWSVVNFAEVEKRYESALAN